MCLTCSKASCISQLYVSGELGDSDLIEEEEEAILAQQMADFINNIELVFIFVEYFVSTIS